MANADVSGTNLMIEERKAESAWRAEKEAEMEREQNQATNYRLAIGVIVIILLIVGGTMISIFYEKQGLYDE